MKVFPFAFAFLLMSLPAVADGLPTSPQGQLAPQEMPGTESRPSEAGHSQSDLAQSGDFRWTMLDEDGAAQNAAPLLSDAVLTRSLMFSADTPTATIEARLRAVAAQAVDEARRWGNVESMRLRLRVRCVSEERVMKRDPPAATPSMPWIWTSLSGDEEVVRTSVEMCSVSVYQSVQMRETAVKKKPYSVLLSPIGDLAQ